MILAENKIKYPHLPSAVRPDRLPLSNPSANKYIPASSDFENFSEADPTKSV